MKIKVCFFINTLDNSGGTERVTSVLANEFVKRGYEVHLIAWYGGDTSFYPIHPEIRIHHIFKHREGNIYKDYLKSLKIYRRLLRQLRPDYLIDVCVALSLLSIPAITGLDIKLISWEHFNTNVSWNKYTAKISRALAAKFSHKVITLTKGDQQNYVTRFKARNAQCIINPLTVVASGRADITQKNILAIGRFTLQKGFDLLLPIWKKVAAKYPGWQLRIIGDGELKSEILELAQQLDLGETIRFIAPSTEVEAYYMTSSIYVMTSRFEGLPLVLIEAKSFGLPIISYDCETGPREIISHEKDGLLIPHLNADKFEEELGMLMKDQERRLAFSNHALYDSRRYDLNVIVEQWLKLLV